MWHKNQVGSSVQYSFKFFEEVCYMCGILTQTQVNMSASAVSMGTKAITGALSNVFWTPQ